MLYTFLRLIGSPTVLCAQVFVCSMVCIANFAVPQCSTVHTSMHTKLLITRTKDSELKLELRNHNSGRSWNGWKGVASAVVGPKHT